MAALLEAARLPVSLSEWEIWACAAEVIRQHGDGAPLHVAERIVALVVAGDVAGVHAWKRIAHRVDQLSRSPKNLNF